MCIETFIQPNFEGVLNLKVGLENLKLQIIAEIKDLIFNEISSLKDSFVNSSISKLSADRSSELHDKVFINPIIQTNRFHSKVKL